MTVEQAQEINSSQNWQAVCEELDLWIQAEMGKLKICTPDNLGTIQDQIAAFERVKKLPEIVIDRES